MRILVFGATGWVGRHVVAEATRRQHLVTCVARTAPSAALFAHALKTGDATDPQEVRRMALGHDVIVSATRPKEGSESELVATAKSLVAALDGTDRRLVVVGGAASLRVPGSAAARVLDDPRFVQDGWRAIARACVEQLAVLESAATLNYSYVAPPAFLEDGERTGRYRVGTDVLVMDDAGRSHISYADFAFAVLDEIEAPWRERRRVTVGY